MQNETEVNYAKTESYGVLQKDSVTGNYYLVNGDLKLPVLMWADTYRGRNVKITIEVIQQ